MRSLTGRRFVSLAIILALAALATVRGAATKEPTVSGEVIETYCWAKLGVGGPAHAKCAMQCAQRGIPVAVIDTKTRKMFILLPGRDKTSVDPGLIAAMGRKVDIHGEIITKAGASFVAVQSWQEQEQ